MNNSAKVRVHEFLLFLALFSGPPRLRSRDALATFSGLLDWSNILNLIVWFLGGGWALHQLNTHMVKKKSLPLLLQWYHGLGIAFCVGLTLSAIASPSPPLTLYKVAQVAVTMLLFFFWTSTYSVDVILRNLFLANLILGFALVGALVIAPELVVAGTRLRGDNIANAGFVAAAGLILLTSYPMVRSRVLYWVCFSLFAFIGIASRTRSSYVAILLFLLFVLVRSPRLQQLRRLRVGLILLSPVIAVFHQPVLDWLIREETSLATLSSRTYVWEYLIDLTLLRSPLIGLGFYTERLYSITAGLQLSAHNAAIEVFYGGGILSSAVFVVIIAYLSILAMRFLIWQPHSAAHFATANLLFASFVFGMVTENMVLASPEGLTFYLLFFLMPVISAQGKEQEAETPAYSEQKAAHVHQ